MPTQYEQVIFILMVTDCSSARGQLEQCLSQQGLSNCKNSGHYYHLPSKHPLMLISTEDGLSGVPPDGVTITVIVTICIFAAGTTGICTGSSTLLTVAVSSCMQKMNTLSVASFQTI